MERKEIERTDFPTSDQGYDTEEVDRHLRRVADAVEELRGERGSESLAGAAAEQVRVIVEAAERSAREVAAKAERDAAAIRATAESDAGALVARVREAVGALSAELEEMRAAFTSARAAEEPSPEPAVSQPEPAADEPEPAQEPVAENREAPAEAAPPVKPGEGHEGARLIALNMALNGTPREETARYLEENFELDDPKAILDEVYSRTG